MSSWRRSGAHRGAGPGGELGVIEGYGWHGIEFHLSVGIVSKLPSRKPKWISPVWCACPLPSLL